jgi:DNA repair exonuclease SbcCD ATPase subunit
MRLEQLREFEGERRNLEAEVRALKRTVADLDSALNEATESNTNTARELETTKAKLTRQSEQYRTKLMQYMNEITELSAAVAAGTTPEQPENHGAERNENDPPQLADGSLDLQPAMQKMHKDLLRTHRERETELQDELDAERRVKQSMARKLRMLINQYRLTRDRLLDFEADNPSMRLLSDQDLKGLGEEVSMDDRRRDNELSNLSMKLSEAREEIGTLKEASLRASSTHSKAMAQLSKKFSELQEEHQSLVRVHQKCDGSGGANNAEHAKAMQQLKELQTDLREALKNGARSQSDTQDLERLRAENQKLRSDISDLQRSGGGVGTSSKGGDSGRVQELESEIKHLRSQLAAGGGTDGKRDAKDFAAKSKEMEKDRAALQMRALQAEEELKNFQQFFQTESMKKEQMIATLKKEVAMWKAKAGG